MLVCVLIAFYAERKFAAFISDRLGPMEVGRFGTFQAFADLLKLLQKEEVIHLKANKHLFRLAPLLIFISIFAGFAVVPIAPGFEASPLPTALFYLFAIIALDIIGILFAGWASANKFSLYGALRAVAQMMSYELPLGMIVLSVVAFSQSLSLTDISMQQGILGSMSRSDLPSYFLGIPLSFLQVDEVGGLLTWNIVRIPLFIPAFIIYYLASLAECNRAPFDLPEAESELIGGFHTEYSGFRWSIFFLAEYALMILVALVGVCLFFGGWNTPLPNIGPVALADWTTGTPGSLSGLAWGAFWLVSKTLIWVFTQIWIRWTYPRLRIDQLMFMSWKVFLPFGTLVLFLASLWRIALI